VYSVDVRRTSTNQSGGVWLQLRLGPTGVTNSSSNSQATSVHGSVFRSRRFSMGTYMGGIARQTLLLVAEIHLLAGAVGVFIVSEAIRSGFDLTIGDGVLRSSVAIVIAAFGALLLREANRHFKEADTSEDVVLSMRALAPFYSGSDDTVRVAAREKVGDAVLVKNVLSRFANRDATKHSSAELESLVKDGTNALKPGSDGDV
jgi:hypothetical protein